MRKHKFEQCKARLLYKFEADSSHRLSLDENDVVTVVGNESAEWAQVQLGRKRGVVPKSYLQRMPVSDGWTVVALYSFQGSKHGHLSFKGLADLVLICCCETVCV